MTTRTLGLLVVTLTACVFGFRGEADVTATYPLAGVDAVRIDLGASPLTIAGDPMAPGLELVGTWRSVGGNAKTARDNATTPDLVWSQDGRFAELRAHVPLALRGQVDFEAEDIRVPPDRDLELITDLGDVQVIGVDGNISVDAAVGRVEIDGGAGGVAISTGAGSLEIRSSGNIDAVTADGPATVAQTGAGGNDVIVTADGDISLVLRSDANLDLQLRGREIRVQTRTVSTVRAGSFERTVGSGNVKVWLDAGSGDVRVELVETPD
jgi:hypothetical protein